MVDAARGRQVVRVDARAKLNVFLRVLARRKDGYHEIETLLVPISLADIVTLRMEGDRLSLTVGEAGAAGTPSDEENLVIVAARKLAESCDIAPGTSIELAKRIPAAAGLGGGSSDAAVTLVALNELWKCGLDRDALATVAAEVGSDVPALLAEAPVLARGRGEIVEPASVPLMWWVLLPLGFPVRAGDAYAWWDEDGGVTGPEPEPVLEAAAAGDTDRLAGLLFNDLEGPVSRRHPEIAEAGRGLLEAGVLGAVMCGSGPTVAGLAASEDDARRIAGNLPGAIPVSGPG